MTTKEQILKVCEYASATLLFRTFIGYLNEVSSKSCIIAKSNH